MPLETATFISDLVVTNPANSDGLNQADDHMRLIKSAVQTTFPNVTGAVTATHTQLNSVVNGVSVLADAGAAFKTSGDGFFNTLAGDIDVKLAGNTAITFQRTGGANFLKVFGSVQVDTTITAAGAITAPGIAPIGSMIMWLSDTLPPTSEGVWVWANGLAYPRTTYATAFARMGTTFGVGDGSTTFNVIDMQSVAAVGKNTMGGAAGNSLLASISTGLRNALNGIFGANQKALATANLPAQTPSGNVTITNQGTITLGGSGVRGGASGAGTAAGGSFVGLTDGGNISATISGIAASFTGTAFAGQTATAFDTVQPSRAVNFIVRLA